MAPTQRPARSNVPPRARRLAALKPWLGPLLIALAVAAVALYWRQWLQEHRAQQASAAKTGLAERRAHQRYPGYPAALPGAKRFETAHYAITTTADAAQTREVADAVEALYAAHASVFSAHRAAKPHAKLKLTLYAHQAQFKANNRSQPWAEAYYLKPVCYAYYARGQANPYHWMIHEATHQLNAEVAGFKKSKWIDEGLATYFGASRIEAGALVPGKIDPHAYPIWWLADSDLSGDLDEDMRRGRWIPIRALITGQDAPDIASNVNRYYVQYWSLTHFLFHGENGRHAEAYKRLIAAGGSLANFEKIVGSTDEIEDAWYRYLRGKVAESAARQGPDEATPVVWSDR